MTSQEMNTSSATTAGTPPPAAAGASTGTSAGNAGAAPGLTTSAPSDWTAGLSEEARGYVGLKGFKEPSAVLESYRQLEKLHGVPPSRIVKLPENMEDPAVMGEIYAKLGRPTDAKGYGIKAPEGDDGKFAEWASNNFFEAGLTAKQGQALMAKFQEFQTSVVNGQNEATTAKTVASEAALKKEWGAAYDQNSKIASRGARSVGMDEQTIDAIEKAIGYENTMKLFHGFGSKTGEDSFVSGNSGSNFSVMTPAISQARINELRNDPTFSGKYLKGDSAAKAEMERLHRMAHPE